MGTPNPFFALRRIGAGSTSRYASRRISFPWRAFTSEDARDPRDEGPQLVIQERRSGLQPEGHRGSIHLGQEVVGEVALCVDPGHPRRLVLAARPHDRVQPTHRHRDIDQGTEVRREEPPAPRAAGNGTCDRGTSATGRPTRTAPPRRDAPNRSRARRPAPTRAAERRICVGTPSAISASRCTRIAVVAPEELIATVAGQDDRHVA